MSARRFAVSSIALAAILAACTSGAPAAPSAEPAPSAPAASVAAPPSPVPVASPSPAPATPDVSGLTPNDLLLAGLTSDDLGDLLPGETWWPYFPEFDVGFSPYMDRSSDPSVLIFVAQGLERIDIDASSTSRQIQSAMVLFEDEAAAGRGLARLIEVNDAATIAADGPSVGDESAYRTREEYDRSLTYPDTATLRFRVGPVVARISVRGAGLEESATLARYAGPVVERIGAMLEGSLRAEPLPVEFAQLMPPASEAVGSILGAAVVPAESWAVVDNSGSPDFVADKLHTLGADSLGFGRASLAADPSHVLEATIFPFSDATSASTWVEGFLSSVGSTGLDAGATGTQSAYTSYDGNFYELQFAAGAYVADVSCFAPYGETSAACEGPVRQLAEAWFAALSGG